MFLTLANAFSFYTTSQTVRNCFNENQHDICGGSWDHYCLESLAHSCTLYHHGYNENVKKCNAKCVLRYGVSGIHSCFHLCANTR